MKNKTLSPQSYLLLFTLVWMAACSQPNKLNYEHESNKEISTAPTEAVNKQAYVAMYQTQVENTLYGANYQVFDKDAQISEYVRKIFQDKQGNLWFASNAVGVSRYDGNRLTYFSDKQGLIGSQVTGIVEDREGNMWFSTNGGVSKYDGKAFTNFTTQNGLSSDRVWSIFHDSKGIIWAGTAKGLSRYDDGKFKSFPIPNHPQSVVRSIAEDKQGNLWFGTDGEGVFKYDGNSFTAITPTDELSDKHVMSILADSKGNIWIGTRFGGISKYDGQSFVNYSTDNGIGNNEVCTIYEDRKGSIWFSAEGFGIYRYQKGEITNYSQQVGLNIRAVQSILEDKQGRFWVGGGDGLYRRAGNEYINITKNGPWDDC
ncbi:two-component regulator propeller domain-containing protein [Marivirga lumbricoides]